MIAPDAVIGKGKSDDGRQSTDSRCTSLLALNPSSVACLHELFNGIIMLTNSSQPGVKLECETVIVA
jgi:hypothetical protein